MGATLPQGFPQNLSTFVDERRRITQPWLLFLVNLWIRTGGSAGAVTFVSGDMKMSASALIQDGWLFCDGTAVSRGLYPTLFAAIGVTWGPGDGATTFNLPNLSDRSAAGAGANPVGTLGGAAAVTVTEAELPVGNFSALATEQDAGAPYALMQGVASQQLPTQSPFATVSFLIKI